MPPEQGLHLETSAVEGDLTRPEPAQRSPAESHRRPADRERRQQKAGGAKTWLWLLVIAAVVGLGAWRIMAVRQAAANKPGPGGRAGGGSMPVPIIPGVVKAQDVPIFLDGLGTMQALNTVTVRARVEGEVTKIAFAEGQDVKEGDLLAEIDPAPFQAMVDQAEAKLRQDQAQLAQAENDLRRDTELAEKKVIAQQEFETRRAQVAQLTALVRNDQAALESAKVQLGYTTIAAPLSGRTGLRNVDQGNIVRANDANGIVVITQLQPISLVFTLPEQTLPQVQKNQRESAGLKVIAVARDNKTVLGEGKLTVIDNQIDTSTGTIRLKAEFPNESLSLWPGQSVNVRLLVETRKGGLTVPAQTIQRGPESAFVYVIKPDSTAEVRPVQVGQIEAGTALVEKGLNAGERVVVDGQYKLQAGGKVVEAGKGGGGPPAGGTGAGKPQS